MSDGIKKGDNFNCVDTVQSGLSNSEVRAVSVCEECSEKGFTSDIRGDRAPWSRPSCNLLNLEKLEEELGERQWEMCLISHSTVENQERGTS